ILSLPVGRVKLLLHKWFAMVSIMALTLVGLVVGMFVTIPWIDGASLELDVAARLVAMTWLMMVAYGTIPFAIGFASGKRGAASGLSILVIIGSFLLSTFAQAVEWLETLEPLSLLHYFPAVDIAKDAINPRDVAVLGGIALVLLAVSIVTFRRRDIA
ncbi:MAG: ABC transporter permease subunit, partial [Candidatus Saccharimonadales bacterium]